MSDTPIQPNTGLAFINGTLPTLTSVTFTLATTPTRSDYLASDDSGMTRQITWSAMPNIGIPSNGQPIALAGWASAFFQATGTWGAGGSVQLKGSNDGQTWVRLSPIALVAAGLFAALEAGERPAFIRPKVTAGDGTTAITVTGTFSLAAAAA